MGAELLDRGVPDLVDTTTLSPLLAAELDHLAGRTDRWADPGRHHHAITARARAVLDDVDDARALLVRAGPPRSWPIEAVVAGSWAAARTGPVEVLHGLVDALDRTTDDFLLTDGVPLGPRSMYAGMLHLALGERLRALAELHDAVEVGDARAPVWGALARLELARAQLGGAEPDRPAARPVLETARLFFAAGGYRHLSAEAARLGEPDPRRAAASPGVGHLVAGEERWIAGFGAAPTVPVADAKGLRALARLVDAAPVAVSAVELDLLVAGAPIRPLIDELRCRHEEGGIEAVEERLRDDRARSRVSKLLRRSIDRLGQQHPYLGAHLAGRITTGYRCRYNGTGVRWRRGPA